MVRGECSSSVTTAFFIHEKRFLSWVVSETSGDKKATENASGRLEIRVKGLWSYTVKGSKVGLTKSVGYPKRNTSSFTTLWACLV